MAGVKGKSGGARAGAGRKPAVAKKKRGVGYQTQDPDEFLRTAMADPSLDFKDRMAAALALKKTRTGMPAGKKDQQAAAAQAVVDRSLAPSGAPTRARLKLVASK